jgi:UDP-N-acetylglucosamine--N-acetylmuramyl-(pentapeptide) pyrophosphoryl-undecaprenol N-acetylglucosamine transferase
MSLAGAPDEFDSPNIRDRVASRPPARRLAIAAGGTGGHITAGLAIAEAYREAFADVSVSFIGTAYGLEGRLVPSAGYSLDVVAGTPVAGESPLGKTRAVWNMAVGAAQARRVLERRRSKLVIGFGGYASAGVLLAARSMGLRVAIQEANVVPGMANRLLSHLANRTYLGFGDARQSIHGGKIRVTGNPVRSEISEIASRKPARRDSWDAASRVVVLGGSLGSRFLNREAPALLERIAGLGVALEVRHQTGEPDPGPVAQLYRNAGISASVDSFISDIADTYLWADFAITSAGALTLAELSASGIPALLIPLKGSAGDHQVANAKSFAAATGGWWVSEDTWDAGPLAERIASLLRGVENWESASKRVREFATPDAARALVADCEELMSGRW